MSRILIIAEHDGSHLNPGTAKCVTCAATLAGASITVAVLARDPAAVASQAAALAGVTRVLAVANPANEHPMAAVLAPADSRHRPGFHPCLGAGHHLRQGSDAARRGPAGCAADQ